LSETKVNGWWFILMIKRRCRREQVTWGNVCFSHWQRCSASITCAHTNYAAVISWLVWRRIKITVVVAVRCAFKSMFARLHAWRSTSRVNSRASANIRLGNRDATLLISLPKNPKMKHTSCALFHAFKLGNVCLPGARYSNVRLYYDKMR